MQTNWSKQDDQNGLAFTYFLLFFFIIKENEIKFYCYTPAPPEGGYTVLPLSVLPSVCLSFRLSQDIFRRIFLSNY